MKRLLIGLACLGLAGCGAGYEGHALTDLMLQEKDGRLTRYVDAIGGARTSSWSVRGLPLFRTWTGALTNDLAWMKPFDFDGNDVLTRQEMTQAWLIKTAELHTGRAYRPDALKVFGRTASLMLLTGNLTTVRGLSLGTADERTVRAALDDAGDGNGARLVELTEQAMRFDVAGGGGGHGGSSGGGGSHGDGGDGDGGDGD